VASDGLHEKAALASISSTTPALSAMMNKKSLIYRGFFVFTPTYPQTNPQGFALSRAQWSHW
jgi:hypothetical protein